MNLRSVIYDLLFYKLSKFWYSQVLDGLADDAKLLDIGIGTGTSLIANEEILRKKQIHVQGIDINQSYLDACQKKIDQKQLNALIKVKNQDMYHLEPNPYYDAVYFSASFMILPSQADALRVIKTNLKPDGVVCFTQTFATKKSRFWEFVKPKLVWITSVHFGKVTYLEPFLKQLDDCGFTVVKNEILSTQGSAREMRIITAKPKA